MSTTYTTNYHLGKQTDTNDNFDMSVITDNMDIIDIQMKSNETNILSVSEIYNRVSNINEFTIYNSSGHRDHTISSGFDTLEVGETYTFSTVLTNVVPSTTSNNNLVFRCMYSDNTYLQLVTEISSGKKSFTFTPEKTVSALYFVISSSASANTTLTFTDFELFSDSHKYTALDVLARQQAQSIATVVNSETDLINALSNGGHIIINSDIQTRTMLVATKSCSIDGRGHKIVGVDLQDAVVKINSGVVIIKDCHFSQAADSVFVFQGTAKVYCYNSEFSRSSTNDGVSGKETAEGYFYNCSFHDNYDEGLSTHGASYCEVVGGEAYRNGYILDTNTKGAASSFGGIHLGGGRMGKVIGVHSYNNCTYGIGLINFQNLSVTDKETCCNNIVENNGGAGIWCTACRELILSNNSIVHNGGDAIHFGLDTTYTPTVDLIKSDGYVCGNTIYGNTSDSIVVDSDAESANLHIQS